MMHFIDFHTHHSPEQQDVVAVVDGRDTWGIHPWRTDEFFSAAGEGAALLRPKGSLSEVLAIGECGLDALRGGEMERQEELFRQHVGLSEEARKPLVVHCVRALDRLLRLHRELRPQMPWMLHGFRGKPQQLRSLLDAGLYVSFGFRHNVGSLRLCPIEKLLLETDDDALHPIREIYNNVACARGIHIDELCATMAENYRTFFQKEPQQA